METNFENMTVVELKHVIEGYINELRALGMYISDKQVKINGELKRKVSWGEALHSHWSHAVYSEVDTDELQGAASHLEICSTSAKWDGKHPRVIGSAPALESKPLTLF